MKKWKQKLGSVILSVILMLGLSAGAEPVFAADTVDVSRCHVINAGGKGYADDFGITRQGLIDYLNANKSAYLGTPYDDSGIVEPGVGMQCTGFVWHVLNALRTTNVPVPCSAVHPDGAAVNPDGTPMGEYQWTTGHNIEIFEFANKADMLASNILEKGDIIYIYASKPGTVNDYHHVGFFWGDSPQDDKFWHSSDSAYTNTIEGVPGCNRISQIEGKVTNPVAFRVFKLVSQKYRIRLTKRSGNPGMTDGNSCYSLANAVYGIYQDSAATSEVEEMVTDANGVAVSGEHYGAGDTYYVKEKVAPAGYRLDSNVYPVTITRNAEKVTDMQVSDVPMNDPGAIEIRKVNRNGEQIPGEKSLAGAEFTIKYYAGDYASTAALPATPTRTWVQKVTARRDGNGVMRYYSALDQGHRVGGDPFYTLKEGGNPVLPLGTVTIEETKAAEGFLPKMICHNEGNEQQDIYLFRIQPGNDGAYLSVGNQAIAELGFTVENTPIYGGVKIAKIDRERQAAQPQGDASLAGAQFEIVSENDYTVTVGGKNYTKGEVVQTITTGADGLAATGDHDLQYGTYQIRESKPSTGYLLNRDWNQTFDIREDGVVIDLTDAKVEEQVIRGGVQLTKQDLELGKPEAMGGGSLAGISFAIRLASEPEVLVKGKWYRKGDLIQTITTNEQGVAETEKDLLPYGTYTVQELDSDDLKLSANASYLMSEKEARTFAVRENHVRTKLAQDQKELIFRDQIKRQDISFRKVADGSEKALAGIPFVITNLQSGEKHVVVTDSNGVFRSNKYAHSRKTNANDGVLEKYADGKRIPSEVLDYKSGTWFGMGQKGNVATVNDELAAFPYGSYTITELPCTNNVGYQMITDYHFTVEEDVQETGQAVIALSDLHDRKEEHYVQLQTTALDDMTKKHIAAQAEDGCIHLTDTVACDGLIQGHQYVLEATLMNVAEESSAKAKVQKEDGKLSWFKHTVSGTSGSFTAKGMQETHEVKLDAFQMDDMLGEQVVVFEHLYEMNEDNTRTEVASHTDWNDEKQTVYLPKLGTHASDQATGAKEGTLAKDTVILDRVSYAGLLPGETYQVSGTLMQKNAKGEVTPVKDAQGKDLLVTQSVTPKQPDGELTMTFRFDGSSFADTSFVVYETLSLEGTILVRHENPEDEDQTVSYRKPDRPESPSPTPTVRTPAKTVVPAGQSRAQAVKTGDSSFLGGYLGTFVMAMVGMLVGVLVYQIRKHQKK